MRPLPSVFAFFLTAALSFGARAQPFAAGYRSEAFPNTTGQGTPSLAARVYYPATSNGQNAPLVPPPPGGYPVMVFLHGFTALGSWYGPLGEAWARAGFVAVMSDTAQFSAPTQVLDGVALFSALRTANGQPGFYRGALDLARVGLCGHSMGGGSTLNVLARNPGYRLGITLAGVDAAGAASAAVPLAFVHGNGDTIVNVVASDNNFAAANAYASVKTMYVLDSSCNHTNLAGFLLASTTDQQVFARASRFVVGFCARYLQDSSTALEVVFGADARSEPRLARTRTEVRLPEVWRAGEPRLGSTIRLGFASEPGAGLLLAAAGRGQTPTPFGPLALDLATLVVFAPTATASDRTGVLSVSIPGDPALVGGTVAFQIGAPTRDAALWLGRAIDVTVVP